MRHFILQGFLAICVFILSNQVRACDVCGCSMSGTSLGILPQFHKNFIGVNYLYRGFNSEHFDSGSGAQLSSDEVFQTAELRGRIRLSNRIKLFVLIPFHMNQQTEQDRVTRFTGLGDITTFANYTVYTTPDSLEKQWNHNVQVGGGIKLPTGRFNHLDANSVLNPNIQTGSGSFDPLLDAIYTVRYKKWGLNSTAFYRFTTTNSNRFRFGNRFTGSMSFFYWAMREKSSFLPNVGLTYEHAQKDVHNSFIVDESGGNSCFTTVGLDYYYKQLMLGVNVQVPTYQDNPITNGKLRFSATLLYNF